jgi:hypothetical protein
LFAEVMDGVFANTEVSEYLRNDVAYSLREMVTVLDHEAVARGRRRLSDVLTSSPPAFNAINGMGFFDWIKADLMQRCDGVLQRSYSSAGVGNLTMLKPWQPG